MYLRASTEACITDYTLYFIQVFSSHGAMKKVITKPLSAMAAQGSAGVLISTGMR